MARKEESGSGPHCEGPERQRRIRERKGDRSPKNRPGEGALRKAHSGTECPQFSRGKCLLAPPGWEARLGDLLQNTEQGSIVKDCI